jgi:hypothetical protein
LTGPGAKGAHDQAITVSPEAKAYVIDWLKADYNVTLQ